MRRRDGLWVAARGVAADVVAVVGSLLAPATGLLAGRSPARVDARTGDTSAQSLAQTADARPTTASPGRSTSGVVR